MDPNQQNQKHENEDVKKDELITDKSIEDPTTSSYGEKKFNPIGLNLAWLGIGIGIGTAIGVATDKLVFGVSLGVLIGLALSIIRRK